MNRFVLAGLALVPITAVTACVVAWWPSPSPRAPDTRAPCVVIGDSIGAGLCRRVDRVTGQRCLAPLEICTGYAKKGDRSAAMVEKVVPAKVAIFSAGANDSDQKRLEANMATMRALAKADRVIWIVPANGWRTRAVEDRARFFGDQVVRFDPRADGVHPKSYQALAASVRPMLSP